MFGKKLLMAFAVFSFMAVSAPSMADGLVVAVGSSSFDAMSNATIGTTSVPIGEDVDEVSIHIASHWDMPYSDFITRIEMMAEYVHDVGFGLSGSILQDFDLSPAFNMYLGLGFGTYYLDGISENRANRLLNEAVMADPLGSIFPVGAAEYETSVLHLGLKGIIGFSWPISSSYDLDVRAEYIQMTEETHFKVTTLTTGTREFDLDPSMLSVRIGLLF